VSDTRNLGDELVEQRLEERATRRAAWVSLARRNSRSLLALGGITGLMAVGWYALRPAPPAPPVSAPVVRPNVGDIAGGKNLPAQRMHDYGQANREESRAAAQQGNSYTGDIPGVGEQLNAKDENGHIIVPPGDAPPNTTTQTNGTQSATPAPVKPPPQDGQGAIGKNGVGDRPPSGAENGGSPAPPPVTPATTLSPALEARLFGVWDHQKVSVESGQLESPEDRPASRRMQLVADGATSRQNSAEAPLTASAPSASTAPPQSQEKLLLPAGRGIYADMLTTADSDHPSEVFADVTTGPFTGGRLIGSFQKSGDTRLVVKFTRLVIGTQPEIAVDGLAVAPDTMETFVASSVEEHLLTRALLPAAMEFASGLSQAMQTGNTTGISNGLGVTTFSHLNLPQELAVAGGTAAQGVLRILQQTTPQQSTVRLEHKTTIGVIFVQAVREKV